MLKKNFFQKRLILCERKDACTLDLYQSLSYLQRERQMTDRQAGMLAWQAGRDYCGVCVCIYSGPCVIRIKLYDFRLC